MNGECNVAHCPRPATSDGTCSLHAPNTPRLSFFATPATENDPLLITVVISASHPLTHEQATSLAASVHTFLLQQAGVGLRPPIHL